MNQTIVKVWQIPDSYDDCLIALQPTEQLTDLLTDQQTATHIYRQL